MIIHLGSSHNILCHGDNCYGKNIELLSLLHLVRASNPILFLFHQIYFGQEVFDIDLFAFNYRKVVTS